MARTRSKAIARKRTAKKNKIRKKPVKKRRQAKKAVRGAHTKAALARANKPKVSKKSSAEETQSDSDTEMSDTETVQVSKSVLRTIVGTVKSTMTELLPAFLAQQAVIAPERPAPVPSQPAPPAPVPSQPTPVQDTIPASSAEVLNAIFAEKGDEQAQRSRKIQQTIKKLENGDYADTDAVLQVFKKNSGQHLYANGKRVSTPAKTKTFPDVMAVVLTRAKYRMAKTMDPHLGLKVINLGLKHCGWASTHTLGSQICFEDVNAQNAASEKRYVSDYGNLHLDYLERKPNAAGIPEEPKAAKVKNVAARNNSRQTRTKELPCFNFLRGKCDKSEHDCPFSHNFTLQKGKARDERAGRRGNGRNA